MNLVLKSFDNVAIRLFRSIQMSDSDSSRGSPDRRSLHGLSGVPMSSAQGNSSVDLTNAEAFQLFSCKLDAAFAENKKTILKEFEAKTSAFQDKGSSFDFKLEHHKERYNFLSDIQLIFNWHLRKLIN